MTLYFPVMVFKGKFHRGFSQKLGRVPAEAAHLRKPVWLHAVSVGEALVAARISQGMKKVMPDVPVVISTTTSTGNEMIKKAASGADAVFYYPVDLRCVVSRVLDKVDPRAYVIVETELWPNMLREAAKRSIPVILANGRISDGSFRNYKRIGFITRKMLKCLSSVCVQTHRDAEKIKTLGCEPSAVHVTGNIKFDAVRPDRISPEVESVRELFLAGKKAIVAGSTHFPEETHLIDAFGGLRGKFEDIKFIIAPRHVERKDAVRIYAERAGFKCCFFSDLVSPCSRTVDGADVMIVDTIGHLRDIYSLAALVFIGGSLAKKGGQNPIEAGIWGKAVVFGPNMRNFREVAEAFLESGAALTVPGEEVLGEVLSRLLEDEEKRKDMEQRSRDVITGNSGAVERTVEVIMSCISDPGHFEAEHGGV